MWLSHWNVMQPIMHLANRTAPRSVIQSTPFQVNSMQHKAHNIVKLCIMIFMLSWWLYIFGSRSLVEVNINSHNLSGINYLQANTGYFYIPTRNVCSCAAPVLSLSGTRIMPSKLSVHGELSNYYDKFVRPQNYVFICQLIPSCCRFLAYCYLVEVFRLIRPPCLDVGLPKNPIKCVPPCVFILWPT